MKENYIYLTLEQQEALKDVVRKGVHNSHEIIRARVLLMLDRTGKADHVRYKRIAEYTGITLLHTILQQPFFYLTSLG